MKSLIIQLLILSSIIAFGSMCTPKYLVKDWEVEANTYSDMSDGYAKNYEEVTVSGTYVSHEPAAASGSDVSNLETEETSFLIKRGDSWINVNSSDDSESGQYSHFTNKGFSYIVEHDHWEEGERETDTTDIPDAPYLLFGKTKFVKTSKGYRTYYFETQESVLYYRDGEPFPFSNYFYYNLFVKNIGEEDATDVDLIITDYVPPEIMVVSVECYSEERDATITFNKKDLGANSGTFLAIHIQSPKLGKNKLIDIKVNIAANLAYINNQLSESRD